MDGADLTSGTPSSSSSSSVPSPRPTVGFPLGTALLLFVIFCLSGVFSCCYHWDKLRSLRDRLRHRRSLPPPPQPHTPTRSNHHQLPPPLPSSKHTTLDDKVDESLPVIMPGDQIPKFMAWPCPCQPSFPASERSQPSSHTTEKIIVEVVVLTASVSSPPPSPP